MQVHLKSTFTIIYPENAIAHNIEGEVEIGFTIERDGSLTGFKVLRGIGYGCNEAVINAIIASPRWSPQIINGRPVASKYSVIFNFKLTDK